MRQRAITENNFTFIRDNENGLWYYIPKSENTLAPSAKGYKSKFLAMHAAWTDYVEHAKYAKISHTETQPSISKFK